MIYKDFIPISNIFFKGTCSVKSSGKRRVIFILCISIPYFIITISYLDILRTLRKSKVNILSRTIFTVVSV